MWAGHILLRLHCRSVPLLHCCLPVDRKTKRRLPDKRGQLLLRLRKHPNGFSVELSFQHASLAGSAGWLVGHFIWPPSRRDDENGVGVGLSQSVPPQLECVGMNVGRFLLAVITIFPCGIRERMGRAEGGRGWGRKRGRMLKYS